MKDNKIYKAAKTEAEWLRYYAHNKERDLEPFDNCTFYDRLPSIGYAKVNTPLSSRCPTFHITSQSLVTDCDLDELIIISGPRNHSENTYTPLEYFLVCNKIPKSIKYELIAIILGKS